MEKTLSENKPFLSQDTVTTGFLHFAKDEISNLPTSFQKEFISTGSVARVIKRPLAQCRFSYEIYYCFNGYNISVTTTTPEKAKVLFVDRVLLEEKRMQCVKAKAKINALCIALGITKNLDIARLREYENIKRAREILKRNYPIYKALGGKNGI